MRPNVLTKIQYKICILGNCMCDVGAYGPERSKRTLKPTGDDEQDEVAGQGEERQWKKQPGVSAS